jgi:myosin heavy subunit
MFIEYLRERQLEFTLSVFVPESGLGHITQALPTDDVIHALHLTPEVLDRIEFTREQGLLTQILSGITKVFNRVVMDQQSQTNVEIDDLLHIKLRGIDQTVRFQAQEHDKRQLLLLEDRLRSVQHELEDRFQKQLEEQIASYKQVELARMKLEEKKQYQVELTRQQRMFEERLLEEEAKHLNSIETERSSLKERERELERNYLKLKQEMLDESHNSLFKEKQLRHETELLARQMEMERNQLQNRMQDVQKQVDSLSQFKEKYAQKMEESMAQYKIDLNKEYSSMLSSVEIEKTKLDAERMMLNERQAAVEKMLAKIHETEAESARYRLEVQDLQQRLEELNKQKEEISLQSKEYQLQLLTQKGSANLEFEISSLKRQLAAAEKSAEQRQVEYENMIKSMMNPLDDVQKELQKARESEVKWKSQCQDLVLKLDAEYAYTDELSKRLNQEKLKNRELEREIADLRLLFHQTQSALTMQNHQPSFLGGMSKSRYAENDPIEARYSQITSKLEGRDSVKIPHPSLLDDPKFDTSSEFSSPPKPASKSRIVTSQLEQGFKYPIAADRMTETLEKNSKSDIQDMKDDLLSRKEKALLSSPKKEESITKKSVPVFKLTSPERRLAPDPKLVPETQTIVLSRNLDQETPDQAVEEDVNMQTNSLKIEAPRNVPQTPEANAKKTVEQPVNKQVEEIRTGIDSKAATQPSKPTPVLPELDKLGQDPLMQKYLDLVKQKRGQSEDPKSNSEPSEVKFDQGDTADEIRYVLLI